MLSLRGFSRSEIAAGKSDEAVAATPWSVSLCQPRHNAAKFGQLQLV